MFKNAYLSFYWNSRGKGKATEFMSSTGVDQKTDSEIEKIEPEMVNLILAEKKTEFSKLPKGKHFLVCLNADFLKTKVKNIQNFQIIEMLTFKQDEKAFKIQLGKDSRVETEVE